MHVEKKIEKQSINKELTSINVETAGEIISQLQLSEIVDPLHLVELGNEFRVIFFISNCYRFRFECDSWSKFENGGKFYPYLTKYPCRI